MNYTAEQENIVIKILAAKNYYDILGVPNNATTAAIAEAHNQLALQVNPQINNFPNAKAAFDAVGKAADILLNKDTRRKYDRESLCPQDETDSSQFDTHAILIPAISIGLLLGTILLFTFSRSVTRARPQ